MRIVWLCVAILFALCHVPTASAESVVVKYRGLVPLDTFQCPALKSSSLVTRLCYDAKPRYLVVSLNGTYYHYCAVEPETFQAWIAAPSLGTFYNQRMKGSQRYDCRLHEVPQYREPKDGHGTR
jgi:hypothetical protein